MTRPLEMTEALNLARDQVARDGSTRFVCHHAGRHEIRFDQPTDRHSFEITAEGVRFRNAERASIILR